MLGLCSDTRKLTFLCSAGLLGLGLCLSGCGGGSMSGPPPLQAGPNAIWNGAALAAASSHWASTQCRVQVEVTSDFGFWSVVVDNSGTTYSASGKWAVGPDSNSLTTNLGTGLVGFYWVSALKNIAGSTSSQAFTADVIVETGSTPQNLGTCTFVLTQKGLT